MDQLGCIFLLGLLSIFCNILWSFFRYIWSPSPGIMPEQNMEIPMTLIPIPNMNTKVLYAGGRPKWKNTTAIPPQQQPGDKTMPTMHPYHIPMECPLFMSCCPSGQTKRKWSAIWEGKWNYLPLSNSRRPHKSITLCLPSPIPSVPSWLWSTAKKYVQRQPHWLSCSYLPEDLYC